MYKKDIEDAAVAMTQLRPEVLSAIMRRMTNGVSKYMPHCGKRQQARYLKQIRAGTLKGDVLTDAVRLTALGLY